MNKFEIIIIGAGIAGLGCAETLRKHGKQFKVITENVGGRIVTSDDGKTNYGAWYVGDDYLNVLPYVKKLERLKKLGVVFHRQDQAYTLISRRILMHPIQSIKLYFLIRLFRKHYSKFKKDTEHISQKEAIAQNPYLSKLYHQGALDYVHKHRIEDIAINYIAEILYGTTFTKIENINAFSFLQFGLPFIVPVYKFSFQKEDMIKPFSDDIIADSVQNITKDDNGYQLKTKKGDIYHARHLVVATPIEVSKQLLNLGKINEGVNVHMFHLRGKIKDSLEEGNELLFSPQSIINAISDEADNSYLFYSKEASPNFDKYFDSYELIKAIYWNPAFNLRGDIVFEADRGNNLYLIGDYNICGLEDSFISGMFVANQIIKKTKS